MERLKGSGNVKKLYITNEKNYRLFVPLLLLLSFALQMEFTVINIVKIWSISLPTIMLIILLAFMTERKALIPKQIVYIILWLIWTIFVAVFISPIIIGHHYKIQRIAYEAVYLMSLIMFFECGYLLERLNYGKVLMRWTAIFAGGVAFMSILTELFGLFRIRPYLYMVGNVRFGGLVGNPNDYMPIALFGLSYWMNESSEKTWLRIIASFSIVFSFMAGGSKGGLIVFVVYIFIWLWRKSKQSLNPYAKKNYFVFCFIVMILGCGVISSIIDRYDDMQELFTRFPAMERVIDMIIHPIQSLNASGSDRLIAWNGALLQIKASPLLGVGIGGSKTILTYFDYTHPDLTPHNIYLELMAQCGIPLAVFIFICFFGSIRRSRLIVDDDVTVLRHMIYLMLLDGAFFASDWSIVPWVFAGILFCKLGQMGDNG